MLPLSPVLPPCSAPCLIAFGFSDTAGTPTPREMMVTVALLLLSLLRMVAAKGGWCPACGVAALAPGTQRDALLALAKQSILAKLRLPARPSVPQPPSRGALLTALRRMRAQRSDTAATTPGMLRDSPARPGMGLQQYEILSFAESGAYGSHPGAGKGGKGGGRCAAVPGWRERCCWKA